MRQPAEAEQIERILRSEPFRASESLCKLLRYLAELAMERPGASVKEHQVATEVFGRKDSFDPRLDSGVRVQVARLRSKLLEYAATEGSRDPVLVEVPRGSYRIEFIHRVAACERADLLAAEAPPAGADRSPSAAKAMPVSGEGPKLVAPGWRMTTVLLAILLLGSIAVIIAIARVRPHAVAISKAAAPGVALRNFWSAFLASADPWVVFSNAAFVGKPSLGLRYYRPQSDPSGQIVDQYTGVGEVLAIHNLDTLFAALNHRIRVKRGRLLSLDDVKDSDVIFVGAPVENQTLNDIPTTREFAFRTVAGGPQDGDVEITNQHPRAGEKPFYRHGAGSPMMDDYFIVALIPGIKAPHWALLLAGTTTIGTQAAAEYVCADTTVSALLRRIGPSGSSSPFEAVLHTKVVRGVPVEPEIVAIRNWLP